MARVSRARGKSPDNAKPADLSPRAPIAPPLDRSRIDLWIALLLAAAILAAYGQVRTHAFINYDDLYYVSNPHVIHGLTTQGLAWALMPTSAPNFWFPL